MKHWFARIAPCALICIAGCSEPLFDWGGGGGTLGGTPTGEPWTIRCAEFSGPSAQAQADSIAETLRQTSGIKVDNVRVEPSTGGMSVLYGTYYRKMDRKTKRLAVSKDMDRDMRLIKQLGVPGRGHFFNQAKFVPLPSPDVGNPEWSLDRANATYSLRVAVFYNEPGFYERKEAAAEYTKALREQGHPAFFRHGIVNSEVFVGEFGDDAIQSRETQQQGGVVAMNTVSAEVRALQAKENFRFELWNLRRRVESVGGKQVSAASQLMPIRESAEEDPW